MLALQYSTPEIINRIKRMKKKKYLKMWIILTNVDIPKSILPKKKYLT